MPSSLNATVDLIKSKIEMLGFFFFCNLEYIKTFLQKKKQTLVFLVTMATLGPFFSAEQ